MMNAYPTATAAASVGVKIPDRIPQDNNRHQQGKDCFFGRKKYLFQTAAGTFRIAAFFGDESGEDHEEEGN